METTLFFPDIGESPRSSCRRDDTDLTDRPIEIFDLNKLLLKRLDHEVPNPKVGRATSTSTFLGISAET